MGSMTKSHLMQTDLEMIKGGSKNHTNLILLKAEINHGIVMMIEIMGKRGR